MSVNSSEISGKMVHAPNCCLHFKQKGCVVAFVFLQLPAGISDNTMLTFLVNLRKNGPKAPWLFVVTEAGIDNKGIGPVTSGVVNDRLGAEVGLKFKKCF